MRAAMVLGVSLVIWGTINAGATEYDQLYPNHVGVCALSSAKRIGGTRLSARSVFDWGHMVLSIKGACRDQNASFPQLTVCSEAQIRAGDDGVVVSVNGRSKNVNWLAIDGRRFSFNGPIDPEQTVDQNVIDRTARMTIESGAYKGITIHEEDSEKGKPTEQLLAESSLAFEVGITYGRDVKCAKLPVEKNQLQRVIVYLNELNQVYFSGKIYKWHPVFNNCAHLVHNALADLGIWQTKLTDQSWTTQLQHLAVPGNEPLDLSFLANDTPLNDPSVIFNDSHLRNTFAKWGWLPVRHGVLIELMQMHAKNEIFSNKGISFHTLQLLDSKLNYSSYTKKTATEPRYRDLKTNLLFFKKLYEDALQARRPEQEYVERIPPASIPEFSDFYERYYTYLQAELDDVKSKLSQFF